MQRVLYRKYRSRSLSEVVGQDHIIKTLSNAISSNRLSHAYLFTGPRGVGKTSVARIIAHEINNLDYKNDGTDIDIIEIDAASNRKIDEIRDIRDKVHILPSSSKYKIYIIDEVHMLTKEAFNALLKTLEEPPSHVIFILATTDVNKLPETIISRTQRFHFKPIDINKAVNHLKYISQKEKITISEEALQLIAQQGRGSFRDSISLLDQLSSSNKKINLQDVEELVGLPSKELIIKLISNIFNHKASFKELNSDLNNLYERGYGPEIIAENIANELRNLIINFKPEHNKSLDKNIFKLLKELLLVDSSSDPKTYLLVILIESKEKISISNKESFDQDDQIPESIGQQENVVPKKHQKEVKKISDQELWEKLLDQIKTNYNTLYGIVKMAHPEFQTPNKLILKFEFVFHQKRVSDPKNKEIISKLLNNLSGKEFVITAEIDKDIKQKNNTENLDLVNQIFQGAELFEEGI